MRLNKILAVLTAMTFTLSAVTSVAAEDKKKTNKEYVTKKAQKTKDKNKKTSSKKEAKHKKAASKKTASKKLSPENVETDSRYTQTGGASFYAAKFNGRRTANGEIYRDHLLTAAHRTLPLGTYVKVTNLRNGKQVVVRINDRGPFIKGRIIDLSKSAAKKIDMIQAGVVKVKVEVLKGQKGIRAELIESPAEESSTKTAKTTKTPTATVKHKSEVATIFVKVVVNTNKEAEKLAKLQKNAEIIQVGKHYHVTLPAENQQQAVKMKQKVAKIGSYPLFIYSEQ